MVSGNAINATGGSESNKRTYTIFLIGIIFLAFSAPWVKQSNFEPATSVILRCAIGCIALLPFAIREYKKMGGINRNGIILSVVAGIFLGIDFTAWNYSIYYVGSGIASVLLNLQIIILPALAAIFDKERIPKSFIILVPLMVLGVVMTGGIFDGAASGPTDGPTQVYGMNLALLGTIAGSISGICYGFYLYGSRKATTINKGQIIQPMLWSFGAQLIPPIIFILVNPTGRGFDLVNGVLVNGELPMNPETALGDPITGMNWFWMIVLAIAGQAIAWTFVQYGSVRLDPTISAGLLLLSPVSTVAIISVVLFAEIPSTIQMLGVVVVLGAVAFQNNLHKGLMDKIRGAG